MCYYEKLLKKIRYYEEIIKKYTIYLKKKYIIERKLTEIPK